MQNMKTIRQLPRINFKDTLKYILCVHEFCRIMTDCPSSFVCDARLGHDAHCTMAKLHPMSTYQLTVYSRQSVVFQAPRIVFLSGNVNTGILNQRNHIIFLSYSLTECRVRAFTLRKLRIRSGQLISSKDRDM